MYKKASGTALEPTDSMASAESQPAQLSSESASQHGPASLDRSASSASSISESAVRTAVRRSWLCICTAVWQAGLAALLAGCRGRPGQTGRADVTQA